MVLEIIHKIICSPSASSTCYSSDRQLVKESIIPMPATKRCLELVFFRM